ncbi:MAG: HEAT repeat domain-containing protein [Planctomycetota bacterium]|nr:HEAT repeat domain-containing protein [Planctomycetota bacterium]MDP6763324.1 HEAT repeat domain-containing protein [Planctomycetota bacterium]MDP6989456.1 HEAT repeat domain-containing protein [Planctomycetota bacterium]
MKRRVLALAALVVGLGAGVGCATTPRDGGRVVGVEELPELQRSVWEDWAAGGEAWERRREAALGDPRLTRFLGDNLFRVMVGAYAQGALARRGQLPGPFERARRDLVAMGPAVAPFLVEMVVVADSVVSFLAGDVLARMDDPEVAVATAARLGAQDREERRRAAELLGRLPHARAREDEANEPLRGALAGDPEWSVRAECARALGARAARGRDREGARLALEAALFDPDPAVGEAACAGLVELGDPRAVPALIDQLEALARDATGLGPLRATHAALRGLTGAEVPLDPRSWRAWWSVNGGELRGRVRSRG